MISFLILNGPNLNMLGIRQPEIYGHETYADLMDKIALRCDEMNISPMFFQSNHEGELIDAIQESMGVYDGIIFNPGAYTHTSIALYDALMSVDVPCVEIHISDPDQREEFRKVNFIRPACVASVVGKGSGGYMDAVEAMIRHLMKTRGISREELLGTKEEEDEDGVITVVTEFAKPTEADDFQDVVEEETL